MQTVELVLGLGMDPTRLCLTKVCSQLCPKTAQLKQPCQSFPAVLFSLHFLLDICWETHVCPILMSTWAGPSLVCAEQMLSHLPLPCVFPLFFFFFFFSPLFRSSGYFNAVNIFFLTVSDMNKSVSSPPSTFCYLKGEND